MGDVEFGASVGLKSDVSTALQQIERDLAKRGKSPLDLKLQQTDLLKTMMGDWVNRSADMMGEVRQIHIASAGAFPLMVIRFTEKATGKERHFAFPLIQAGDVGQNMVRLYEQNEKKYNLKPINRIDEGGDLRKGPNDGGVIHGGDAGTQSAE
jgi:hypothetical protein